MGFFSNIVDNFKGAVSNLADSSLNIIGNITNILKPQTPISGGAIGGGTVYNEFEYDDLYDDYTDWINEVWY